MRCFLNQSQSNFIDELISKFINASKDDWIMYQIRNKAVIVDGKVYNLNILVDKVGEKDILIIELRSKFLFLEKSVAKAVLSRKTGNKVIYEDDLWKLGIS